MAGGTKTPSPSRKAELMTSEGVVERLYVPRPSFAENAMPGKRLIDFTEIKPGSTGSLPAPYPSKSGHVRSRSEITAGTAGQSMAKAGSSKRTPRPAPGT